MSTNLIMRNQLAIMEALMALLIERQVGRGRQDLQEQINQTNRAMHTIPNVQNW